jgi:hypothetical protein
MPTRSAMCFLVRIRWVPASRIEWRCFCRQHMNLLQLATVYAPDQNPLLAQLALSVVLWAYLEKEVHELLERLRFTGHDESYYVHEKTGLCVAVEHDGQNLLLFRCQPCSCCCAAGHAQCGRRTMVSIFCSSLPFSRAVLSSLSDGTSAALSWCTYCCPSALRSSIICGQVFPSYHTVRILEESRHVAGQALPATMCVCGLFIQQQWLWSFEDRQVGCYVYRLRGQPWVGFQVP